MRQLAESHSVCVKPTISNITFFTNGINTVNCASVIPYAQSMAMGCAAGRCAQEPPPSTTLFACVPKPHRFVWPGNSLGSINTPLRPFWWLIFTPARNGPFFRIFHPPPSRWKAYLAPFLHPFRTPFVEWNPFSAPFLRGGGVHAKAFCPKGSKYIHRVSI